MTFAVVDYGGGNVLSVMRAFAALGVDAKMTSDVREIAAADRLILPGVGAFGDVVSGLKQKNLIAPIRQFLASGRPFLGICVGMQLLFERSTEFGTHEGFGIIPGEVTQIPSHDGAGQKRKVPHVGWSELLRPAARESWSGTPLEGIADESATYFVHSFAGIARQDEHVLAEVAYDGYRFTAAVQSGAIFGCQFHPEKSGPVGLTILNNFIRI